MLIMAPNMHRGRHATEECIRALNTALYLHGSVHVAIEENPDLKHRFKTAMTKDWKHAHIFGVLSDYYEDNAEKRQPLLDSLHAHKLDYTAHVQQSVFASHDRTDLINKIGYEKAMEQLGTPEKRDIGILFYRNEAEMLKIETQGKKFLNIPENSMSITDAVAKALTATQEAATLAAPIVFDMVLF